MKPNTYNHCRCQGLLTFASSPAVKGRLLFTLFWLWLLMAIVIPILPSQRFMWGREPDEKRWHRPTRISKSRSSRSRATRPARCRHRGHREGAALPLHRVWEISDRWFWELDSVWFRWTERRRWRRCFLVLARLRNCTAFSRQKPACFLFLAGTIWERKVDT